MDTMELTAVMTKISLNNHFHGVIASDQLPKQPISLIPTGIIINTDPSHRGGEHWLAVYITEDRAAYFFDSFGNEASHYRFPKSIYTFLRSMCTEVQSSTKQIQAYTEVTCGHHCAYFLYHMYRGLTYEQFLSKYSNDLSSNDRIVQNFVRKMQPCEYVCNDLTCIQHVQYDDLFAFSQ